MFDWILKNKITTLAIVIVVIGLAYYFIRPAGDTGSQNLVISQTSDASEAERTFVSLFQQLEQINLDASFFDQESYQVLKDESQPVNEELVGKNDPLAPL